MAGERKTTGAGTLPRFCVPTVHIVWEKEWYVGVKGCPRLHLSPSLSFAEKSGLGLPRRKDLG